MRNKKSIDIFFAGIGGQGCVTASEITAQVLFDSGYDVKLTISRGVAKRFGAVNCQLRAGKKVYSQVTPNNKFDIIVSLNQINPKELDHLMKNKKALIVSNLSLIDLSKNEYAFPLNMVALGKLSRCFEIKDILWMNAIRDFTSIKYHSLNIKAFKAGRDQ